jgi:hypothetical protein
MKKQSTLKIPTNPQGQNLLAPFIGLAGTPCLAVAILVLPAACFAADQPFLVAQANLCVHDGPNAGRLSDEGRNQLPKANMLEVGEWRIIPEICPREKFFPTSVIVSPGATYRISAVGRWKDLWITSGPKGWWFPPFQPFNRIPWQRMFVLSGSVGSTLKHTFVIGDGLTWTAPAKLPTGSDAELQLFPNDWESKYENNRALLPAQGGPMRVTIRRLS